VPAYAYAEGSVPAVTAMMAAPRPEPSSASCSSHSTPSSDSASFIHCRRGAGANGRATGCHSRTGEDKYKANAAVQDDGTGRCEPAKLTRTTRVAGVACSLCAQRRPSLHPTPTTRQLPPGPSPQQTAATHPAHKRVLLEHRPVDARRHVPAVAHLRHAARDADGGQTRRAPGHERADLLDDAAVLHGAVRDAELLSQDAVGGRELGGRVHACREWGKPWDRGAHNKPINKKHCSSNAFEQYRRHADG